MNFKKKLYSSIVACSMMSVVCMQAVEHEKSTAVSIQSEPSCTLAQLNTEHIEKYTAEIYAFMKWNTYARVGCIAAATTLAATGAWALWTGTGARLIEATNFTDDINQIKQNVVNQNIQLAQMNNQIQLHVAPKVTHAGAQVQAQVKAPEGWLKKIFPKVSAIAGGFLNIVMMNALGGYIANQLYGATHVALRPIFQRWDAIFGAQGIVWFISQKTRIKQLLGTSSKMIDQQTEGTLLTLAQDLTTAETVREQELIIALLIQNMNLLTIEFEKLLAYMHYKQQTCDQTFYASSNGMKVICQRATHDISTFINDIQVTIAHPDQYKDLEKIIIMFIRSLNAYKAAFDNHERAIAGLI